MSRLILLDNTILTNFALVDRAEIPLQLWPFACTTTAAVLAEYQAGVDAGLLPDGRWSSLASVALTESRRGRERYDRHPSIRGAQGLPNGR